MNDSTPTPQPLPSFPHALMASRPDSKNDDKDRKGGSSKEPKPSTDINGPSVVQDYGPQVVTGPGGQ